MAGFFGFFDYSKPGPGVPRDAPPKSPFIVFFEVLQRKFWNLIKVNLMFNIFNIPAIILGMLVMLFFFPNILPDAMTDSDMLISDILLKFVLLTLMMCIPMVTVGPAQAGFTYILRNYSREEHAFLWGDFKETAFKNMKQSFIVSTVNFLVTFLMLWSIRAYIIMGSGNFLMMAGTAIMVMLFIIFSIMNMYIYPIMITFQLSIKQIYRNALIFAVIKFIPNIGILLLNALIILLTFGMIIPFSQIIGIILYIFLTVSLTGFLTNFYVYPKLKKYMIARVEEAEEEDDDEDEDEDDEDEDEDEEDEEDEDGKDGDGENESDAAAESAEIKAIAGDEASGYDDASHYDQEDSGEEDGENQDESSGQTGDDGIKRYF